VRTVVYGDPTTGEHWLETLKVEKALSSKDRSRSYSLGYALSPKSPKDRSRSYSLGYDHPPLAKALPLLNAALGGSPPPLLSAALGGFPPPKSPAVENELAASQGSLRMDGLQRSSSPQRAPAFQSPLADLTELSEHAPRVLSDLSRSQRNGNGQVSSSLWPPFAREPQPETSFSSRGDPERNWIHFRL